MVIKAQILDESTGKPLEGASIYIVNKDGTYLGQGVAASTDGKFSFDSPLLSGNYILITENSHDARLMATSELNDDAYTIVTLPIKGLAPVYVTPHKNTGSWYWWVLAGASIYAYNRYKNKKEKRKYAGGA